MVAKAQEAPVRPSVGHLGKGMVVIRTVPSYVNRCPGPAYRYESIPNLLMCQTLYSQRAVGVTYRPFAIPIVHFQ